MADLGQVMDEIATALETIEGLRVYPYLTDKATPPFASVEWPDSLTYDSTMQRGSDSVVLPVLVVVGRADSRTTRDRLAKYANGSGSDSVKAAIENRTGTHYHSARVTDVEFSPNTRVGGTEYMAAIFHVDISMKGND